MDSYKTIKLESSDEFIEKRSRFIGYCKPVSKQDEAMDFINQIKSKHYNARHNVYAYSLRENQTKRYSDDGEPQGTAGVPVLDVLQKNNVIDCVLVVTRYFGGILLGGGGLVRAYSHAASLAVEAGKIITMKKCSICSINCTYSQLNKITSAIYAAQGIVDDTSYTDTIKITFHIAPENIINFNAVISDITNGAVQIDIIDEKYYEMVI